MQCADWGTCVTQCNVDNPNTYCHVLLQCLVFYTEVTVLSQAASRLLERHVGTNKPLSEHTQPVFAYVNSHPGGVLSFLLMTICRSRCATQTLLRHF